MQQINYQALFIIVNAGFSSEAVELIQKNGASGATIVNARGTGAGFASIVGIKYEPEREMIISVVTNEVAERISELIRTKMGKETPCNGICFSVDVKNTTSNNYIK